MDDQPELDRGQKNSDTSAEQTEGASPSISRRAQRAARLAKIEPGSQDRPTALPLADPPYSLTIGEAMRSGAVVPVNENEPVPQGKLAALAHEINVRFDLATRNEKQANDNRLAAALRLAEAKAECDRIKLNFRKWAEASVPQSYETVRRMVYIGQSSDPEAALAEFRSRNALRNKAMRERQALEAPPEPPAVTEREVYTAPEPPPKVKPLNTPDDMVLVLINHLPEVTDLKHLRTLADDAAARLPKAEQQAHVLALAKETGFKLGKGDGFKPSLSTLRNDFKAVSDEDRGAFLSEIMVQRATTHIEEPQNAE